MKLLDKEEFDNLCEQLDETQETRMCDGYDDCCLGIATSFSRRPVLVYSVDAILAKLRSEMSEEDASEYYHYNIIGAYLGEGMPAFLEGEVTGGVTWGQFLRNIKDEHPAQCDKCKSKQRRGRCPESHFRKDES